MIKRVLLLYAVIGFIAPKSMAASASFAASVKPESLQQDCGRIVKQLELMNLAQKDLLNSMVKKNELLADTLDHFADDFESHGRKINRGDLISLRNSAQAFRRHETREVNLVQKFEFQAEQLIKKTNYCLDESTKSSEFRQSTDLKVR